MAHFEISIETPRSFCDIDFQKVAEHFGNPVDVIANLEGTVIPWGYRASEASVASNIDIAIRRASMEESIVGVHGMTNRGGTGGKQLTSMFSEAVRDIDPTLTSLGEYPRNRRERKPNGIMGPRLIGNLREHEDRWLNPKRAKAATFVIAFVGDKLSDMLEAEKLQRLPGVAVVGFMVERYGDHDHPLDSVFGKRRRAIADREALSTVAERRFARS